MCKINEKMTAELYNKHKLNKLIKQGECYNNCFHISNQKDLYHKFLSGEFRIALCYFSYNVLPLWIRHCVIINKKNEILDFTLYKADLSRNEYEREYKIFKVFDSYIDYLDEIEKSDFQCDFPNTKEEYDFYIKEKTEDMFLMVKDYDFYEYIIPVLKKYGYNKELLEMKF